MKKCSKCQEVKSLDDFYKNRCKKDGLQTICKVCQLKHQNQYHEINKERNNKRSREYNKANKERLSAYGERYRQENKLRQKEYDKKRRQEKRDLLNQANKIYREANREKINEYVRNRRKMDPVLRATCNLRRRLYDFCKHSRLNKNFKTMDSVGLTSTEFKSYIESLFLDGMSWYNYGRGADKWAIDHIKPLRTATTVDELFKLNHYTNLQPLWNSENYIKGGKWDEK